MTTTAVSTGTARVLGAGDWFDPAGVLLGSRCPRCGSHSFPPRAYCGRCGSGMSKVGLPTIGRLVARSTIRIAPAGFPAPYEVGVVALLPDLHVFARLTCPAPERGDPVRVQVAQLREDDGEPVLGPVFGPTSDLPEAPEARAETPPAVLRPAPVRVDLTIAGVATTAFGRPDLPVEQLAAQAALAAVADAGLAPAEVDAVVVGSAFSTAALGQRMLRHVPWGGRRLVNVENACASGSTALAEAVALVRSGLADVVVAVGADVPVRSGGGLITLDRDDPVAGIGVTLPSLYALVGDRYRTRYEVDAEAFAEVVVRSREAAATNPDAFRRAAVTRDEVLGSRAIADPLTLFECAPNADGAAAVVVVADRLRHKIAAPPVELTTLALHSGFAKDRFSGESIVARLSGAVYAAAGVEPGQIGVVELHDAFAPGALTNLEYLGLAEPGTAAARLMGGGFRGGQEPALNPGGGLLSRGHPPGATGLAQVTELVRQLRGDAGDRQLADPGVALLHTMGGTVLELETNACAIGVLRRVG
jgi:acetyl-CoA acetyltransferase/uncharacterized OB-fold protein